MYLSFVTSFILISQGSAGDTVIYHSAEGLQLTRELERAFCEQHGVGQVSNEVEARVCGAGGTVSHSICDANNLKSCYCDGCDVCCRSDSAGPCRNISDFGITEGERLPWSRQSALAEHRCEKEKLYQKGGFTWKLCSKGEDGKVCDMYRKDNLEVPMTCQDQKCTDLACTAFLTNEIKVSSCTCGDGFNQICCSSSSSACLPYGTWLAKGQDLYATFITSNAELCAPDRHCKCSTKKNEQCHQCCRNDKNQCESLYEEGRPWLLAAEGTKCNGDEGVCKSGNCMAVDIFCEDPLNEGEPCGEKHRCTNKRCEHLCGSENNECICDPQKWDAGYESECHVCCRRSVNECVSMFSPNHPQSYIRKGLPCRNGSGTCDDTGSCGKRILVKRGSFFGGGAGEQRKSGGVFLVVVFVVRMAVL